MKDFIIVFIGGGIGASLRFGMVNLVYRVMNPDFPYGTLAVNVLGSLLIGVLMSAFDERFVAAPILRIFLTIGILGGFTTYSSFSYETIALLRGGEYFYGMVNIVSTTVLCLGATYIGHIIGRVF